MDRETLERQKQESARRLEQKDTQLTRQANEATSEQWAVQKEQLSTLKKIHFWVKFWSVVGIVTFAAGVLAGLIVLLGTL